MPLYMYVQRQDRKYLQKGRFWPHYLDDYAMTDGYFSGAIVL